MRYLFLIFPITTFGLGTWQVARLRWKEDLIATAQERLAEEPVPLPLPALQQGQSVSNEWDYRRVIVLGEFDHRNEVLLGPRIKDQEAGFHVLTPLIRPDGSVMLVNRGWIPKRLAPQALRKSTFPQGLQLVVGFLKQPTPKGSFVPENEPSQGNWFWIDLPAIGQQTHYDLLPVVLNATENVEALPIPHPATVEIRNQHLTYIVTWYSLTICFAALTFKLFKKPVVFVRR